MTCYSRNRECISCTSIILLIPLFLIVTGFMVTSGIFATNYVNYRDLILIENCNITYRTKTLDGKSVEYKYTITAKYEDVDITDYITSSKFYEIGILQCYYDYRSSSTERYLKLEKVFPQARFITYMVFTSLLGVLIIYYLCFCLLWCCNRKQRPINNINIEEESSFESPPISRHKSSNHSRKSKDNLSSSSNSESFGTVALSYLSESSNKIQLTEECTICREQKSNTLLKSCNHICCCLACAEKIKYTTCPICRKKISSIKLVFRV